MDEADPGVEQQGEGHGLDPPRLFVGPDGGGEVEGDGRLNENEALPRGGGQQRRLDDEPGVEILAPAYSLKVRGEHLARSCSLFHRFVEAKRHGFAEVPDDGDDETLQAAEAGEDGAVGDSRFGGHRGGGRG